MSVPSVSSDSPPENGSCSPYDTELYVAVASVSAASNFISLLANCLVLFLTILFKRWSFFNQRLVLYLSLATIGANIASIFGRVGYENQTGAAYNNFCIFSGFVLQVTMWMVLNAYICITASLLLKVLFVINLEKYDVAVFLVIFASPVAINWIPFIRLAYGRSGAWCWIRATEESSCKDFLFGSVLQLVLWYIPLYVILGILIIIYSVVVTKFCLFRRNWLELDPQADDIQRQQALKYSISLLAYPVIYFVTNIFPLINRVYNLVHPDKPSPALWFLTSILFPLQGVGIAVAFLLDRNVRKRLNATNFKAACAEWFKKPQIKDYPLLSEGVREESIEYQKYTH